MCMRRGAGIVSPRKYKKEESTTEAQRHRERKRVNGVQRNGAESVRLDAQEPFAGNEISLGVSIATSAGASLS